MTGENRAHALPTLISGIARSLCEAKRLGDLEAFDCAESYRVSKALAGLRAPSFSLAEVEMEIRFTVAPATHMAKRRRNGEELSIHIESDFLKKCAPHEVSVMRLKFAPGAGKQAGE